MKIQKPNPEALQEDDVETQKASKFKEKVVCKWFHSRKKILYALNGRFGLSFGFFHVRFFAALSEQVVGSASTAGAGVLSGAPLISVSGLLFMPIDLFPDQNGHEGFCFESPGI